MESLSSDQKELLFHLCRQIIRACELIEKWNRKFNSATEYLFSDENIETMAATCMIEAIGEQVKRIHRLDPNLLQNKFPDIPWKNVMGLRDRIAHGYFQLDEEIIFDVVKNDVPQWKECFENISLV